MLVEGRGTRSLASASFLAEALGCDLGLRKLGSRSSGVKACLEGSVVLFLVVEATLGFKAVSGFKVSGFKVSGLGVTATGPVAVSSGFATSSGVAVSIGTATACFGSAEASGVVSLGASTSFGRALASTGSGCLARSSRCRLATS